MTLMMILMMTLMMMMINDGVEHVYWQPFFGRNPSQELSGKCNWLQNIFDLTLLSRTLVLQLGHYSLTICNENFHEVCIPVVPHKAVAEVSKIGNL